MTALREDQFETFLTRGLAKSNGVLIYGDDQAAADDYAARIAARIGGTEGALRLEPSDHARVGDEFRAQSLLGDRRAIIFSGATETALKSLVGVFEADFIGNFLVITAASLNKSSKLRAAAEQAALFGVLPLYEAKQSDLEKRVDAILAASGLKFAPDGRQRFFELVGTDRMIVTQEAEKLTVYCLGQTSATLADVEAACGDVSAASLQDLLDGVLAGDLAAVERGLDLLEDGGSLPLISYHLQQLQVLVAERASGKSVEAAIAGARPMIPFARRSAAGNQLRAIDQAMIERIQQALDQVTLATRRTPSLLEPLLGRTLMSIARDIRPPR